MKAVMLGIGLGILSGCAHYSVAPEKGDAFRFKVADGSTIQCEEACHDDCGLTMKKCSNKHEYHCLSGVDLEVSASNAPLPAAVPPPAAQAPRPAPQPQQPAPPPAPQK